MNKSSALLVIDMQKGFDATSWGTRNQPQMETQIARLLKAWRKAGFPVIHVRHASLEATSPLRPELPGYAYKAEALPQSNEKEFSKTVNSAFIGTELETYLHAQHISQLVIVGLTTDHCVSTTTRMAGNLGFDVVLLADATATFDRTDVQGKHFAAEQIHEIHLASLHAEFCQVQTTEDILRVLK